MPIPGAKDGSRKCAWSRWDRVAEYERCFELFDGNDSQAVDAARGRWQAYKDAGHALTYWQQTVRGGWKEKGL